MILFSGMIVGWLRGVARFSSPPAVSVVAFSNLFMSDKLQNSLNEVLAAKQKRLSNWIIEDKIKTLWVNYQKECSNSKAKFLQVLASRYTVDRLNLSKSASDFLYSYSSGSSVDQYRAQEKLNSAATPLYLWIFRHTGRCIGGVRFLVNLRADLIDLLNSSVLQPDENLIPLQQLNTSLRELLALWFGVGFLTLERITLSTEEEMLSEISKYDAVHPLQNRTQMDSRLTPYRRCHIYTHGSMPSVPLIVLYTALLPEIADQVQGILNRNKEHIPSFEDPHLIKAAVFYSISSTQKGLQGIDLGNYLIKRVVYELINEFPNLKQFSSLSPIPGFRIWVLERAKKDKDRILLNPNELDLLRKHLLKKNILLKADELLIRHILLNPNLLLQDQYLANLLKEPLLRLCAHYLYNEKRRGYALNSVANFHLRNGAEIWRLNWMADISDRGLNNSFGIMVNYRYFLENTEGNVQSYLEHKEIIAQENIKQMAKNVNLISKL